MRSNLFSILSTSVGLSLVLLLSSGSAHAQGTTKKGGGGGDDSSTDTGDAKEKGGDAGDGSKKKDPSGVDPPNETWDISDVEEVPGRTYFFVGLRYRGNVIPQFMLNMFLDEGKTIYTNQIGVEFDVRKDNFSLIPALVYHEIGTGDLLFKQKNTKDIVSNYSLVNSGMKVVYASVDLLWSTPISKNVAFEYGAGFGVGAVFGDLENTWVREDGNGRLANDAGRRFTRCETVLPPGAGCNRQDHQNSEVDKVGGYKEKSWFDGGSKPVVFPWIALPQLGLRIKPIKQFVGRIGIGFALTGFWFGLSGQYGLEKERK